MDWMYKGISGIADREEYLTGRKIDKTFEMIQREENPNAPRDDDESALINQLAHNNFAESYSKNDQVAKMREDPLFAIQMKQHERRKEMLHNPVKLKHLQEMLKTSLKKDKKHKKKDKKKSKKKHKQKDKKSNSRRSPSSERHRHRSSSRSNDSSSEESDKDKEDSRKRKSNHRKPSPDRHNGHGRSHHREYRDDFDRKRTHSESSSNSNHHQSQQARHSSASSSFHRSHSAKRFAYDRPQRADTKPKMSEEEMRKRREEMMANAEWREQERASNVKKLCDREREEDKQQQSSTSAEFIKPMLSGIASDISIENSIRQKKFTSQRGPGLMDSNFARRN